MYDNLDVRFDCLEVYQCCSLNELLLSSGNEDGVSSSYLKFLVIKGIY